MTKAGQVDVPPTPNAMLIAGIIDEDKKAKTTSEIVLQKIRRFETYRQDKILILVLHGD